jgi:hypothetical protein
MLSIVRPARPRPVWPRPWVFGWITAAVAVVVLGGLSLSLEQRGALMEREMAAQTQLLALLASPSVKTAELTGATPGSVRLVFDPLHPQGALVVTGLRDPGQRSVYQVWLISGPGPPSAGVFRPAAERVTIVTVAANVSQYHAVAISIEPGPAGSPQPTTKPVLLAMPT